MVAMDSNQTPASLEPTITVGGAFAGGGNNGGDTLSRNEQYRFHDTLSLVSGNHNFKAGTDVSRDSISNNSASGFNGNFLFSSLNAYQVTESGLAQGLSPQQIRALGGGASQFSITTGEEKTSAAMTAIAVFATDTWTPLPNVSISAGLRIGGELGTYGHPDVAPRLGFTYGIDGTKEQSAKTRLFGGYGWSYSPFPLTDVLVLKTLNGVHQQQYLVNAPDFYPNIPPINTLPQATSASLSLYRVGPRVRDSYTMQGTAGISREINKVTSLFFLYNNARSINQLVTPNVNAPLPGTYDPADPTSGMRPFGNGTNIYEYQSEGVTKQTSLAAGFRIQAGTKLNLSASYGFTRAHSDVAGAPDAASIPSNPYDLQADYGRIAAKNTFDAFGQLKLPFHIDLMSSLRASSGQPFNIVVRQDLNGDGQFSDRPSFASDLSRPSVLVTKWGFFDTLPVAGQTIVPYNYGTGPGQVEASLYLSKSFPFGSKRASGTGDAASGASAAPAEKKSPYKLQASLFVQNVFNIVNWGPPVGTLGSTLFGHSTSLATPGRSLYLQTQFSF
jgi:hypothetical protein